MWPDKTRDELPIMPKGRYDIMLRHMPRVGTMGLDMMLRTCTIQVNLDYSSEADMVQKFRLAWRCSRWRPRCSPIRRSPKASPTASSPIRSHIWSDTDPAPHRHAALRVRDGFGYERYVDYMLDVPMYFVYPRRQIHRRGRAQLPRFPEGRIVGAAGRKPTAIGLGRSSVHRLSRSAAEKLPRNARRRWRPVEPHLRAAGAVGRPAL
jgi:glutamate--cysteine ligase